MAAKARHFGSSVIITPPRSVRARSDAECVAQFAGGTLGPDRLDGRGLPVEDRAAHVEEEGANVIHVPGVADRPIATRYESWGSTSVPNRSIVAVSVDSSMPPRSNMNR